MVGGLIVKTQPRALILFGDGINCERETALAFSQAGAQADIIHINELLNNPSSMSDYDLMALPGGFSFGDELGSGQLMALKIRHGLMAEFKKFIEDKKPIIGICNGFQVLVKLGLLPFRSEDRKLTLTQNNHGQFINKWVDLEVDDNTNCKWISKQNLSKLRLPIRHGEGNLNTRDDLKDEVLSALVHGGHVVLRYIDDVNGSLDNIAGICDSSGLIFGLMPHPEAAIFKLTEDQLSSDPFDYGVGLNFFKPIINYISQQSKGL
jgi:phosphoribosylformylglycinamidine synthase I